jgi:hypothetical protein
LPPNALRGLITLQADQMTALFHSGSCEQRWALFCATRLLRQPVCYQRIGDRPSPIPSLYLTSPIYWSILSLGASLASPTPSLFLRPMLRVAVRHVSTDSHEFPATPVYSRENQRQAKSRLAGILVGSSGWRLTVDSPG